MCLRIVYPSVRPSTTHARLPQHQQHVIIFHVTTNDKETETIYAGDRRQRESQREMNGLQLAIAASTPLDPPPPPAWLQAIASARAATAARPIATARSLPPSLSLQLTLLWFSDCWIYFPSPGDSPPTESGGENFVRLKHNKLKKKKTGWLELRDLTR